MDQSTLLFVLNHGVSFGICAVIHRGYPPNAPKPARLDTDTKGFTASVHGM